MDLDELTRIITEADRSAFRLEALPQYLVSEEEQSFAAWKAGTPEPLLTTETSSWLATIQERTRSGCRWYRVHVLDYPLSEYAQFELYCYRANQAAGEEIYLADRAAHSSLKGLQEDFWLVDDELAIQMIYDDSGHFVRPERVQNLEMYLDMRNTALQYAKPLNDYLIQREL